ncbi:MAG: hypothetical protein AAFV96_11435, partial [Pseudomonadota bacterium]
MKSATLIAAITIGISGIAHAEAPDLEAGGKLYKNECLAPDAIEDALVAVDSGFREVLPFQAVSRDFVD